MPIISRYGSALCVQGCCYGRPGFTYTGKPLPKRWLLMLITVAGTAGIVFTFHTLFGREAGVTLLMMLATLKLMELRDARDAMVLIYLACFIIITNFFYSQSIPTALYLLATMMVIVTTWVHLQAQGIALKPRVRIAAVLLLQALPLTLILFILFPRVQGPLWGLPQDAYASTGLDDRMSPGSLSRLSLSEAVAFRVVYNGKPPRRDQMYWRGPVLWQFDGRAWTPGRPAYPVAPKFTDLDQPIDYVVTLEPHQQALAVCARCAGQVVDNRHPDRRFSAAEQRRDSCAAALCGAFESGLSRQSSGISAAVAARPAVARSVRSPRTAAGSRMACRQQG